MSWKFEFHILNSHGGFYEEWVCFAFEDCYVSSPVFVEIAEGPSLKNWIQVADLV